MRATEKNKKKNITGKIFVISRNELVFIRNVLFISRNCQFFLENRQQCNARAAWADKKHMFFLVMRSLNLMCALI